MKSLKYFFLLSTAIVLMSAATLVKNNYTLADDYVVTIHGTSNLHDWDEKVETVTGDGIVNWNKDGSFDLSAINIKMDVRSIKSDNSVMDNNTYKALKAEANPKIIFTLNLPVKSIQAKANEKIVSAKGNLTIAGVTKPVDMQVKVFMREHGKLAFEGSQTIKMSDYDVDPPTALLGTIRTGNEITLHFKTNFTQQLNN